MENIWPGARRRAPATKPISFALVVCDRMSGEIRDTTRTFDRWVGSFTWSGDSQKLFFSADSQGAAPIYVVSLDGTQPTELASLHADDLIVWSKWKFVFYTHVNCVA